MAEHENHKEFSDTEVEVTVGTTVVSLAKNNPNRLALILMNRSDTEVFISTKRTISTARGFSLVATRGQVSYTKRDFGNLPTREWFAISSAANKTIVVQEVLKV